MCVAAPGKVIEIKIGDYVLVHAGLIIQVLPEDEAKNMLELFEELSEL